MFGFPRLACLCTVVLYLAVALAPCPPPASPPSAAAIAAPVPGHAHALAGSELPPCHAPELTLRAPCACGCGERADAVTFASVGAALRAAAPILLLPGAVPAPLPGSERATDPAPGGLDPVPRSV